MSVDNTIIILKNRGSSGGYEYRVALVVAAENLYPMVHETNADAKSRQWFTLYWFNRSQIYLNSRKARANARRRLLRMRKQRKIVEFGIQKLNLENELFPVADQKSLETWLRTNNVFPFQDTRRSSPTAKPTS
jgi:hypothetical protein